MTPGSLQGSGGVIHAKGSQASSSGCVGYRPHLGGRVGRHLRSPRDDRLVDLSQHHRAGGGPGGDHWDWRLLGLVSEFVFSSLLILAEGGKELRSLSTVRVALWGALATAVFPLLTPTDNSMLVFLCPMGAALAAGSVFAAKRALRRGSQDGPELEEGQSGALLPRGETSGFRLLPCSRLGWPTLFQLTRRQRGRR